MATPNIRDGRESDLPRLVEIINRYIVSSHATFDEEIYTTVTRRPWFEGFGSSGRYRLLVVEDDSRVVGYATSTPHRPKTAYGRSVETTIYLDSSATGAGLGTQLYGALLDLLRAEPMVHRGFAGVAMPNPASVALHERLGYQSLGTFREVGFKFDRYWDVRWYEVDLSGPA